MNKPQNNQRIFREERFEFVFYVNNNIICQRFFQINNFNEESLNSTIEIKEMMNEIIGMDSVDGQLGIIPNFLKQKSKELLWKYYNPYYDPEFDTSDKQQTDIIKNIYRKIINYQFEVKVDKKTLIKGEFNGNTFPAPSEDYQVNIREIIPQIIDEIRSTLSKKNYTVDDELVANNEEIKQLSLVK